MCQLDVEAFAVVVVVVGSLDKPFMALIRHVSAAIFFDIWYFDGFTWD